MATAIPFHGAVPVLRVRDLAASVRWYIQQLGCTIDWSVDGVMTSVGRGAAHLMLCQGAQGPEAGGCWVWIGVGDADALHAELVARGTAVALPPTNYPWALEMHVQDPDGHVLRLGSEPLADRPIVDWIVWYPPT